MRIAVIGGGLTGLAAASRLCAMGHAVTVYEKARQPGGLATYHDFGRFVWDRFYHVILPTDTHLIRFLRELGLGDRLVWRPTRTGYYVDRKFYSLSNNIDFLLFPPLGLWSKLRLALSIIYCSRISDWQRLEQVPLEEWLVRTGGRTTFEKFWKPLLLAKLGENYRRASAVFIWSYIKRLFSARDATSQREHLGYVQGGYRTVFDRITARLAERGGSLVLGADVTRVAAAPDGGIHVHVDGRVDRFDKAIFTGPMDVLRRVVDAQLVDAPPPAGDVEYLGVVCMVLVTRRPLVPYYILNIGDERIPFTGVIGMTSLVDTSETAGLHLTYLPKYVLSTDPILRAPDEELRALFFGGIREMFPDLEDSDIESVHINRAVKVQPLQVVGYSRLVQAPTTRHADFFVVNTAQFVANTLNNNEVIRNVESFFEAHGHHFSPRSDASTERAAPLRAAAG